MSDWIDVKEQLPDHIGNYEVVIDSMYKYPTLAFFDGEDWWDIIGSPPVSHWRVQDNE